jgi:hypothetical protein
MAKKTPTPTVDSEGARARLAATKAKAALTPRDLALLHWPSIPPRPYAPTTVLLDESTQRGRETRGPDGTARWSPNGPGPDAYGE